MAVIECIMYALQRFMVCWCTFFGLHIKYVQRKGPFLPLRITLNPSYEFVNFFPLGGGRGEGTEPWGGKFLFPTPL